VRLKGITKYLNSPYRVQNAVSHLSPFIMRRRLNTEIILSFV